MGGIRLSLMKIGATIFSTIGDILLFFGAYNISWSADLAFIIAGIVMIIAGEGIGVYLVRKEDEKTKQELVSRYLAQIGTFFAFPVLLAALYLFSRTKFILLLALLFAISAFLKTVALLAKVYLIENT